MPLLEPINMRMEGEVDREGLPKGRRFRIMGFGPIGMKAYSGKALYDPTTETYRYCPHWPSLRYVRIRSYTKETWAHSVMHNVAGGWWVDEGWWTEDPDLILAEGL